MAKFELKFFDVSSVDQLCNDLGRDPLLVQGAGGNVSWKDGDILWIKGSGKWLAHAGKSQLFVPVDLSKLRIELSQNNFNATPELASPSIVRPSIETILHALMPQKIVVHLHAVNPLALLVLHDAYDHISQLAKKISFSTAFVDYCKPGAELANLVDLAIKANDNPQILFLKNHGIVLGGESNAEIFALIKNITTACQGKIIPEVMNFKTMVPEVPAQVRSIYKALDDSDVQQLSQNPSLYSRLTSDWVLYPDHAVFLGPDASIYEHWEEVPLSRDSIDDVDSLIFIKGIGVFVSQKFNMAQAAQLRCYFDVLSRVSVGAKLDSLSRINVMDLLNWDAEKLRQSNSI
jgi:rhamnose utilization protein RhaD (predicted bifunctional aldolase and dehydrogenase)